MWNCSGKRKLSGPKDIDCCMYRLNISQSSLWTTILLIKNGCWTQCNKIDSQGQRPGKVCFTQTPRKSFFTLHLNNYWYKFHFLLGMLLSPHSIQINKHLMLLCDRNSAQIVVSQPLFLWSSQAVREETFEHALICVRTAGNAALKMWHLKGLWSTDRSQSRKAKERKRKRRDIFK